MYTSIWLNKNWDLWVALHGFHKKSCIFTDVLLFTLLLPQRCFATCALPFWSCQVERYLILLSWEEHLVLEVLRYPPESSLYCDSQFQHGLRTRINYSQFIDFVDKFLGFFWRILTLSLYLFLSLSLCVLFGDLKLNVHRRNS